MRANPFVQKTINKVLGDKIELLEFFEEPECDEPEKIYYQIKLGYKETIIYAHYVKEAHEKEPIKEEILKEIDSKIREFKQILNGQSKHNLISFIANAIRIRFYEEKYERMDYDIDIVGQWIDDMEIWVKGECDRRVEQGQEYYEIYDFCIKELGKNI